MAVIGDPEGIAEIFAMPNSRFRWNHRLNILALFSCRESLLVSDGEDHRRRRGAVMGGFARRRLNGWIPMIVSRADSAIDQIVRTARTTLPGQPIDLYPAGRTMALSVVLEALLGERMAGRVDEIAPLIERPQAYLESPAIRQIPHPLPRTRRAGVRADRATLDRIVDEEIAFLRSGGSDRTPDVQRNDVLASMVQAGELSDSEMRDQVVTLIGAGFDTTAAAFSWLLWRAVLLPGLWPRLAREADDAFGPGNADPADERTLAQLTLAAATVHESLRLHPAGLAGVREAMVDLEVRGYRIPARTIVAWSPYLSGRDPSVWSRPLEFDPDRFLDLTAEQRSVADRLWVPFGGGTRNCIGFVLAQMELTVFLARFAQRLELSSVTATVPAPYGMAVNRPRGGSPFAVRARDGADSRPRSA
jgi:cytochrome P450